MKIDNPMGKTKYWRRLLHPPEFAAFALKYSRHRLRFPWVRPALERLFMDRVKDRYRNFDPRQQLWQTIAIQTIDDCNGRCCFCPNSLLKRTKARMSMDTFARIIGELEELDYRDAIVLDLQCDPFLDERMEEFTGMASSACPRASVFLSTNGLALTESRYHEVMQWPNVDLVVNDYTVDQRILEKVGNWHIAPEERRRSRFVCKPQPVSITNLGHMPSRFRLPLRQSCIIPFRELSIVASGQSVICCSDWQKEQVMGDVRESSLREIWCGEALQEVRAELMNNVRAGLCGKCDEMGHRPRMRAVETVPVMAEVPELCSSETHERSVVASVPYRDGDD